MPQNGVRGWPVVEVLQNAPAIIAAAATLVPGGTCRFFPATRMLMFSGMRDLFRSLRLARGQIGFRGDFGFAGQEMIRNEAARCK